MSKHQIPPAYNSHPITGAAPKPPVFGAKVVALTGRALRRADASDARRKNRKKASKA